MTKSRKSWSDKLANSKPAQVQRLDKDGLGMKTGQLMLISSPADLDKAIRRVPEGKCIDVKTLRERLAKKAEADVTCPLATGIFLRIVAEAANEARSAGAPVRSLTPVWRVLDAKSPLMKKLSFDTKWVLDQRARENL